MAESANNRAIDPKLRLALDYGPLLLFGAAYLRFGFFTATAVLMAAITLAIAVEFAIAKKVTPMLLVMAAFVIPFGALTLWLANDFYLKVKPTVYYVTLAVVLMGGLVFDRLFLKLVLGNAIDVSDRAWRTLTWRWAGFFLMLACLNEFVWRDFSTEVWVAFKVFGAIPLTFLFALAQVPFMMRHQIEPDPTPPA